MNSKLLASLGFLAVVVLGLSFLNQIPSSETGLVTLQETEKVVITIKAINNNEIVVDKVLRVSKGTNAFQAMQQATNLEFKEYPGMGAMIISINGVQPLENQYWALYVNGEYSSVGISSISLEKDTVIEWKIESFE